MTTTERITHWIDGRLWDDAAQRHGDVYDPATGDIIGNTPFMSSLIVSIALIFAISGAAYGKAAGTLQMLPNAEAHAA